MHNYLIPLGGVLAASGILSLIFGFSADTGAPMASTFSQLGYTGLDNLTVTPMGWLGMALVAAGLVCMVAGNATAWKKTGGY